MFYTPDLLLRFIKHHLFSNNQHGHPGSAKCTVGSSCLYHHRGDGRGREQWPPAPHRCAFGCPIGDGGGSRPFARHGDARDRAMVFVCQPGGPPFRLLDMDIFLYSKSLDYHKRCRPGKYVFIFIFSECTSYLNFFQRVWFSTRVFSKPSSPNQVFKDNFLWYSFSPPRPYFVSVATHGPSSAPLHPGGDHGALRHFPPRADAAHGPPIADVCKLTCRDLE